MDSRMPSFTVSGEESPSARTSSDQASTTARDIELLPLAPGPEASDESNKIYNNEAISNIGTSVSIAALDVPDSHPQQQEDVSVLEPLHSAPNNRPSAYNRLVLDTWICESIAIVFSIGCVVAIAFTVGSFQGEPIPELPSGVTLNAVISLLSTAARAALIFVVSAAIGQLKWCWFLRSGRRLQDLQTMDEASRGPLGAFWILVSWTGGSLATLGAFITICTIAFGPFFQQLVDYPTRDVEQANLTAVASRNANYTTNDFRKLSGVMTAGLVFGSERLDRGPSCPTAWCSWDSYKSVGWCSKCKRIDGHLNDSKCIVKTLVHRGRWDQPFCGLVMHSNNQIDQYFMKLKNWTDIRLPLANRLNVIREIIYPVFDFEDFVAADGLVIPHPFLKFRHAIVDRNEQVFQNLTLSDQNPLRLGQFNECALTFCEREYTTETIDGITSSNLTSTDYGNFSQIAFPEGGTRTAYSFAPWCWYPKSAWGDITWTSFDGGLTYQDESQRAFCPPSYVDYMDALRGIVVMNHTTLWYFNQTYASDNATEFERYRVEDAGWSPTNISLIFENIAAALTSYGLRTSNLTATGKALLPQPYVRVRWQWIALPAFLELASLVLLLSTIFYSRRIGVPIWKSSLLAVCYHDIKELRETGRLSLLSDIDKDSSTTSVQFFRDQDEPGFLLRRVSLKRHED